MPWHSLPWLRLKCNHSLPHMHLQQILTKTGYLRPFSASSLVALLLCMLRLSLSREWVLPLSSKMELGSFPRITELACPYLHAWASDLSWSQAQRNNAFQMRCPIRLLKRQIFIQWKSKTSHKKDEGRMPAESGKDRREIYCHFSVFLLSQKL